MENNVAALSAATLQTFEDDIAKYSSLAYDLEVKALLRDNHIVPVCLNIYGNRLPGLRSEVHRHGERDTV